MNVYMYVYTYEYRYYNNEDMSHKYYLFKITCNIV